MKLNDKVYDILKWIAMYLLPGLATLYFTLASIWGLPYGEQILGTISALDTFLAVLLGISNTKYSGDGTLLIDTSGSEKDIYRLELNDDFEALKSKKMVVLKTDPNAKLSQE